jgi:hypothetical protein
MNSYIYTFHELTPYPGIDLFVWGYAEINWERYPAEPDVGIMRGGISFDVNDIFLTSYIQGEPAKKLDRGSELYTLIEREILERHDTFIEDAIKTSIED